MSAGLSRAFGASPCGHPMARVRWRVSGGACPVARVRWRASGVRSAGAACGSRRRTQNSLPSGSASTTNGSLSRCPMSTRRAPSPINRSTSTSASGHRAADTASRCHRLPFPPGSRARPTRRRTSIDVLDVDRPLHETQCHGLCCSPSRHRARGGSAAVGQFLDQVTDLAGRVPGQVEVLRGAERELRVVVAQVGRIDEFRRLRDGVHRVRPVDVHRGDP